ncbi:GumC family protein [Pseudooceanicola algae]|uniref:non-specific protein-tyrosine kinase n=1 Tax=Pseudooceanicola algae TaxID=1537215 RepID=A0A418SDE0_9RHOB|nr:polysaccharide biosynthesis tyrosine autokinase [Pseudooceanicola algae]QPM92571.1 Tyrosine-protein kinase etk [Pseudooceanicola algae]
MNQTFPTRVPSTASGTPDGGAADFIDLGRILQTLWRGKFAILAAMVIGAICAGYYAFAVATPLYRSTSVVMLNNREEQVVDIESVLGGLSPDRLVINSEVEILNSRSLNGQVVDALNLTEDPEFNGALRPASLTERLRQSVSGLIGTGDGTTLSEAEREAREREATINALQQAVTVRNVPTTLVFDITAKSESPRKAALIADTVAQLYIEEQLAVKFAATEQATSWLSDRVAELRVELEDSEAKVTSFNLGAELINQETLRGLERQLKELRDRIAERSSSLDQLREQLARIQAADTPLAKAEASGDAQLQRMISQGGADDPAFAIRLEQVIARLDIDVQRGETQLQALSTSETELGNQIDRQGADLLTLQQLTREAEASRLLYEYFLSRLKQTSAQRGIQQADSRQLSTAIVPVSPFEPRKSMMMVIGAMLGLFVSAALLLIRESRNNTFREAETLEGLSGYSVLGNIPLLPARRRKDALEYLASRPTSAAAEAIRNLRTSVLLSNIDSPPQVIMMTSSLPGEGKTTLSLALSQSFGGMGKKVLLIEGDIRRRVFSQYFDIADDAPGLVAVLDRSTALKDAVVHNARVGADILIGDKTSTNAADLFSSESFATVLREAREQYDQIIIDTPPVLIVPDARVIAHQCDAVIFTVKWDHTSHPQVLSALKMFESVNLQISGLALNQINPKGLNRYGYGGKSGAYSQYAYTGYGKNYYTN